MVSRVSVVSVMIVGALLPATFAMNGDAAPSRQSAIVRFERPTWVASQMLVGTYVIVHDEARMTRGEPCTAFYRVGTPKRPLEEVVSFHCIPRNRRVVAGFTVTVSSNSATGTDTLTEYQFAGDSEGHGVPIATLASGRSHGADAVAGARLAFTTSRLMTVPTKQREAWQCGPDGANVDRGSAHTDAWVFAHRGTGRNDSVRHLRFLDVKEPRHDRS